MNMGGVTWRGILRELRRVLARAFCLNTLDASRKKRRSAAILFIWFTQSRYVFILGAT